MMNDIPGTSKLGLAIWKIDTPRLKHRLKGIIIDPIWGIDFQRLEGLIDLESGVHSPRKFPFDVVMDGSRMGFYADILQTFEVKVVVQGVVVGLPCVGLYDRAAVYVGGYT